MGTGGRVRMSVDRGLGSSRSMSVLVVCIETVGGVVWCTKRAVGRLGIGAWTRARLENNEALSPYSTKHTQKGVFLKSPARNTP